MSEKKPFQRLPTNVIPSNYDVKLTPDLDAFTFSGTVDIDVNVRDATNTVVMNSADMTVSVAKFSSTDTDLSAAINLDAETETLTLVFPSSLPIGQGKIYLEFTGSLNDQMRGFYRTKYKTDSGEMRYAAVTQFESTDARRALPCWDEPALKATFDVTLVVPKDRVALSNMPVISDVETEGDLRVVRFDRTPIMSTYLLAFIVGEYDYVEATDSDGVLHRVYTPVGKKEQGLFALEVSRKTLPFYKEYFGIAYPLPKMDLIAIADFASGAMENWGLVTYRETALLIDPANSSSAAKQYVALVVGHELAHQWFGNLVTMEWWTHLWLNEGFASFIEYLCVDHCFPEFDIWTQFVSQDLSQALDLDALKNSHPIEVPVGHPAEVDEIFDSISYSKGASVIRMLHGWIGDQAFRKGLNHYLTKFEYKNTFTEDLWECLESASGKPVKEVMSTWTSQMGFPVLKVEEKQEGNTRLVTVTQSKFCADGKPVEGEYHWLVPVNIVSSADPSKSIFSDILREKTATFTLENIEPSTWIKLNPEMIGVYRVQYTSAMLDGLISGISTMALPARDRLGLQNDLFALARAGLSSTVDILKVAQAFKSETDFTVWSDLASNLRSISILTEYTDYNDLFLKYQSDLFADVARRMGWEKKESEAPTDSMLRSLVLAKLAQSGHSETVEECMRRFDQHFIGDSVLDADFRSPVYVAVLKHGNGEYFERMLQVYEKAEMSEEKVRILKSLGYTNDPERLSRVLAFSLTEKVRPQDAVYAICSVANSPVGRKLAWEFLKANWQTKIKQMYKGGFIVTHLIKSTLENFTDTSVIPDVKEFFEANPCPSANRAIQQSCENIELNAEILARDREAMRSFFNEFQKTN